MQPTDMRGTVMRTCNVCQVEKELTEFYFSRVKGIHYPKPECKACSKARSAKRYVDKMANDPTYALRLQAQRREWKSRNPEAVAIQGRRNRWKQQGMDPDKAETYYQEHKGLCDMCHEPSDGKSFVMDHDHITGEIRGMLHNSCNLLLGQAKDS